MFERINFGLAIRLTTFCLCFLVLTSIPKDVWPQDESMIEIFMNDLNDEDPNVRVKAAHALLKMGPEAEDAVPALIGALEDEDETVRWYAAETLDRLNTPEAQKALEAYKKKE